MAIAGDVDALAQLLAVHTHNGIETVAIDIEDDRIVAVYSVRNPEKLRHVS